MNDKKFTFKISEEYWDCIRSFEFLASDAKFIFIEKKQFGRPWIVLKTPIQGFDMIELEAVDGLGTNACSKFHAENPYWANSIKDSSTDVYEFVKDWLYSIDRHDIVIDVFSRIPHTKDKHEGKRPAVTTHGEC